MTLPIRAAFAVVIAGIAAAGVPAGAAELPAIRTTSANTVPQCATPGRLMAFLSQRNGKLDEKFVRIADAYMRHGEDLGLRWDIAFFQMMLETGNLTFTGDVKPNQNNFAGLGATGKREPGETFSDVSTGVRAHLEHILMYSGAKVENPVAERTRKVQEWGVLTGWQKTIKGPMTYQQLARQWAPRSRKYAHDIETVADSFYDGPCKADDPHPEWVAEARGQTNGGITASAPAKTQAVASSTETPGQAAARRSIEDARGDSTGARASLGAANLAKAADAPPASPETKSQPAVTILNGAKTGDDDAKPDATSKADIGKPETAKTEAAKPEAGKAAVADHKAADKSADKSKGKDRGGATVQVAAAATTAHQMAAPAVGGSKAETDADKQAKGKCNVWTASYGGQKAIIIKAVTAEATNYTVLDVNEGAEKREAEAYISAYAKDGVMVGEFTTSDQALDKAFQLCPEG